MPKFTFDCKVFVTVHVVAPDEAAARSAIHDMLEGVLEGSSWIGKTTGLINSAGLDGELDLVEVDGEEPDAD